MLLPPKSFTAGFLTLVKAQPRIARLSSRFGCEIGVLEGTLISA